MFELSTYHIVLAAVGICIILASWLPRFVSQRQPATSALLILGGLIAFYPLADLTAAVNPVDEPRTWELVSEFCVIIGLFGTGLRIDRLTNWKKWRPTMLLLTIAMPMTILLTAMAGWMIAGMTLAGGLLLGAILAPTDPVLAGDVQVGPPSEGGEHPVRYTLTTEAGLNDGLAFPFVHLGVAIVSAGTLSTELAGEWLMRDVLYRIAVGGGLGWVGGWLLGKLLFDWPKENALSKTESGVVAMAGVLLVYGVTELAEGYGFIAAFLAGLTLRRVETHHEFHRKLHDFSESLEHAVTALLLVGLGAVLPYLWPHLGWAEAFIGVALIFFIRPATAWVSIAHLPMPKRQRFVIAFYGVRGIGSIYYLAYAGHQAQLKNEYELWATVAFTIVLSAVVHGFTAGIAVDKVTKKETH